MKKIYLVLIIVLSLAILAVGGYFLYRHFIPTKNILNRNLPGALFGPRRADKAAILSPDKIIEWTNYYRIQNGLKSLTKNDLLTKAAQSKVDDMFKNQYFEHISPAGVTPADRVSSFDYSYKVTGENLALGDFSGEKDLVDAWMNSPGHRANILNIDYTEIGVASGLNVFSDRGQTWLSVQEFGKPMPNCIQPDENTLNDVNSKKSSYDNLILLINSLNADASSTNNLANQKIQQGNDIYSSTHDISQAQPYWDEGNALRAQAEADLAQAHDLQTQATSLSNEIKTETDQYNAQANIYNTCIAQ